MIDIIEGALEVYPTIEQTLFVDDVSAEKSAGENAMIKDLVGFTMHVSRAIVDAKIELSDVKCGCNASTDALGEKLEEQLAILNTTYKKK